MERKNKKKENKASGRKWTRQITKTAIELGTVVIIIGVATGSLMSFFVNQTSDIHVQSGILTWDDVAAEQLSVTENFSIVPGGSMEYQHYLNLSSQGEPVNVSFTISDTGSEPATGINMSVYYYNGTAWVIITNETTHTGVLHMDPGDSVQIRTEYNISYYTIASDGYEYTLELGDNNI